MPEILLSTQRLVNLEQQEHTCVVNLFADEREFSDFIPSMEQLDTPS